MVCTDEIELACLIGDAPEEASLTRLGPCVLTGAFASDVSVSHEASNTALPDALAMLDKGSANARAAVTV